MYPLNVRPDGLEEILVVQEHLRSDILHQLRELPLAGSHAVYCTYHRVRRRFSWPDLYLFVVRYVGSCERCQCRKIPAVLSAYAHTTYRCSPEPFFVDGFYLLGIFLNQHLVINSLPSRLPTRRPTPSLVRSQRAVRRTSLTSC